MAIHARRTPNLTPINHTHPDKYMHETRTCHPRMHSRPHKHTKQTNSLKGDKSQTAQTNPLP